jgi:hypothetical protein
MEAPGARPKQRRRHSRVLQLVAANNPRHRGIIRHVFRPGQACQLINTVKPSQGLLGTGLRAASAEPRVVRLQRLDGPAGRAPARQLKSDKLLHVIRFGFILKFVH